MECKKCGAPVLEGAVFCGHCGARVDGKKPCTACGQLNEENYSFCVYCGTRIDGKIACSNCGTVYEGNFCPACGTAEPSASVKDGAVKKKEGVSLFGKICGIIGGASMMLGVLFSLIFVFFIGMVLVQDGDFLEKVNIFTFFGEYYEDMKDLGISDLDVTAWWEDLLETHTTLYGVFGTVLSATTVLCVVAFAIVAIVKYILGWVKKTENKASGWALASVLSFLVGAILFYGYINETMDMVMENSLSSTVFQKEEIHAHTKFNGATVTAIVLCLVFVGVGTVFELLKKGKAPWTGKNLAVTVSSLVCVALVGVTLAISQFASFGFYMDYQQAEIELSSGFGMFNISADIALVSVLDVSMGETLYNQATTALGAMNIYNLIAQIAVFALAAFAGLAMYANIRGVQGGRNLGTVWSACAVGASVLLLVFDLLAWGRFVEIFKLLAESAVTSLSAIDFDGSFGAPICAVVFSVLLLAASIVRSAFAKKQAVEE